MFHCPEVRGVSRKRHLCLPFPPCPAFPPVGRKFAGVLPSMRCAVCAPQHEESRDARANAWTRGQGECRR